MHRKCQKSYVNPKLIESFKRKKSNFPVIPQRESRSATQILSFQNYCFLCAKVITEEFLKNEARKGPEQRDHVVEVTQLNIRNEVLYLAKRINNEWSDGIVNRLNPVTDLVAEEAKYHNSCMKKLNILAMKAAEADGAPKQKRGRSVDQVEKAMSYIFNYLDENSSECQFSLQELINEIKCDYHPHVKTIKAQLIKKYGDGILISDCSNKSTIISFRGASNKILTDAFYSEKNVKTRKLNESALFRQRLRLFWRT